MPFPNITSAKKSSLDFRPKAKRKIPLPLTCPLLIKKNTLNFPMPNSKSHLLIRVSNKLLETQSKSFPDRTILLKEIRLLSMSFWRPSNRSKLQPTLSFNYPTVADGSKNMTSLLPHLQLMIKYKLFQKWTDQQVWGLNWPIEIKTTQSSKPILQLLHQPSSRSLPNLGTYNPQDGRALLSILPFSPQCIKKNGKQS